MKRRQPTPTIWSRALAGLVLLGYFALWLIVMPLALLRAAFIEDKKGSVANPRPRSGGSSMRAKTAPVPALIAMLPFFLAGTLIIYIALPLAGPMISAISKGYAWIVTQLRPTAPELPQPAAISTGSPRRSDLRLVDENGRVRR